MVSIMDSEIDGDSYQVDPLTNPSSTVLCIRKTAAEHGDGPIFNINVDFLTDQTKRGVPSPPEILQNRVVMTVLHFLITYPRWSISLFLLFASWTTPLPTLQEQVNEPINNLHAVVHSEAKLYHQCVQTSSLYHNSELKRATLSEVERVAVARASISLGKVADRTEQCFSLAATLQQSLQEWRRLGLQFPNKTVTKDFYHEACNADDRNHLDEMLDSGSTAIMNNVESILEAYTAQSLSSLYNVLYYTRNRTVYDYNYFVGLKLQVIVDVLDNFTVPFIELSLPDQHLLVELRNLLNGLINGLKGAYVRIDLLTLRLAEFEASIKALSVNYVNLYGRFALIGDFVRDFVPSGIPLPDFFDISGVPVMNALLPPIFQVPQFAVPLPGLEDLISEYIVNAIALIAEVMEEAAKQASDHTHRIILELIELLRQLTVLEDYDPPKYPQSDGIATPEDEVDRFQDLIEKSRIDSQVALGDLKSLYGNIPSETRPNIKIDDVPAMGEYNKTHFQFLELTSPELKVPAWILSIFGYVYTFSFLIECIIQALRFYRLKCKYEKSSTPDLPEIEYADDTENTSTTEKQNESKKKSTPKMQAPQTMLPKTAKNPMVLIGFMMIPSVAALLLFWFPHIKSTCIDSRRGSFLARRVFKQILVNKANLQGFALQSLSQTQCHQKQRVICSHQYADSELATRNAEAVYLGLQSRRNQSLEILRLIDRCVATVQLDGDFQTSCCGLEGYTHDNLSCEMDQQRQFCPINQQISPAAAFQPIGEGLLNSNSNCHIDEIDFSSQSILFDCTVLERSCNHISCLGVDAELIEKVTIEVDCSAEIYIIHICLFLAVTVFHAFSINLWDMLLFTGIVHVRWRQLKQGNFKLTTRVTAKGDLMKGDDVHERSERVEKAIKRFEASGWFRIVLSAMVFSLWLFTFALLKKLISQLVIYHE